MFCIQWELMLDCKQTIPAKKRPYNWVDQTLYINQLSHYTFDLQSCAEKNIVSLRTIQVTVNPTLYKRQCLTKRPKVFSADNEIRQNCCFGRYFLQKSSCTVFDTE